MLKVNGMNHYLLKHFILLLNAQNNILIISMRCCARSFYRKHSRPKKKLHNHGLIWLKKKRNDLFHETDVLNITQKKLLIAIANNINQELTSKDFLGEHKLASSSVINSLKELMEDDFIEKKMEKYQLVDPLLKTVIKHLWN